MQLDTGYTASNEHLILWLHRWREQDDEYTNGKFEKIHGYDRGTIKPNMKMYVKHMEYLAKNGKEEKNAEQDSIRHLRLNSAEISMNNRMKNLAKPISEQNEVDLVNQQFGKEKTDGFLNGTRSIISNTKSLLDFADISRLCIKYQEL